MNFSSSKKDDQENMNKSQSTINVWSNFIELNFDILNQSNPKKGIFCRSS